MLFVLSAICVIAVLVIRPVLALASARRDARR